MHLLTRRVKHIEVLWNIRLFFQNSFKSESISIEEENIMGFSKKIIYNAITATVFCVLALGCSTATKQPTVDCSFSNSKNLSVAIENTKQILANGQCVYEFNNYIDNLFTIASGDPSVENKEKFSKFFIWANTNGIITKVQARDYYNQYFTPTFTALPDQYNVCSVCKHKEKLIDKMKSELRDKELGLMKVCNDQESFYKANTQFDNLTLLLDATCLSCGFD